MSIIDKLFNLKNTNDVITLFEKFTTNNGNLTKLIEKSYESNVDAYSVIKKIVDVYSSAKWIVEQKIDGEWEEVLDTTVHNLMDNPNMAKGYTWKDIDEQLSTYLLTSGNSYTLGTELNGKIEEIDILPSNHIEISSNNDFFLPNLKYTFEIGKTKRYYDVDQLEHIKLFNPSYQSVEESYKGLSVFQVAANVIQVGNDKWDAQAHLLQNRGMAGMLSDQSDRPMTAPEAKQAQISLNKRISGTEKYGGVGITNKNLKYIPMAMSATDLQIVESGVITLRAMCNVLGLDSSLFNDPANKTFNNRLEAEKAMYTNVVIPLADKIAAKHTKYIVKNHYPDGNYRMRKDFSRVEALQSDKKQEAEKDKIVMEGINIILMMPIDKDSKIALLQENYDLSEETINALNKIKDVQPIQN